MHPETPKIQELIDRGHEQLSESKDKTNQPTDFKTVLEETRRLEKLNEEMEAMLWPRELEEFTKERTLENAEKQIEFLTSLTLQNGESVVENGKIKAEYCEDELEHTLPTVDDITNWIKENKETVANREKKGFTPESMQVTPFALKVDILKNIYGKVILEKYKQGKLLGQDDEPLELDENNPVFLSDEYKELKYDISSQNPEGITKTEAILRHGAFQIVLTPDFKNHELFKDENGNHPNTNDMPREGKYAEQYLNKSANTLLGELEEAQKSDETQNLAIPEDVMVQYIKHLESTDHVLGDYNANGAVTICQTIKIRSDKVPWLYWGRNHRQAYWGWCNRGHYLAGTGGLFAVRGELGE